MNRFLHIRSLTLMALAIAMVCLICEPATAAGIFGGKKVTTASTKKVGTIKGHVEEDDGTGLPPLKGPKKIVAVGKFENKSKFTGQFDLGTGFADMLANALDNANRFIVINRSNIEDILAEQDLAASDRTVTSGAAQTGKLLNAQFIIIGAVTEYTEVTEGGGGKIRIKGFDVGAKVTKAHIAIILRMIDTTSGQEITQRVEGKAQTTGVAADYNEADWGLGGKYFTKSPLGKAIQNAIDQGVLLLGTRMLKAEWTGKVVLAKPGKIYINVGERNGVKVGDTFVVYRRGEELRDPDTGELLDFEEEKLGSISVITVKEKIATCMEDELKEGAEVQKGDVLKIK